MYIYAYTYLYIYIPSFSDQFLDNDKVSMYQFPASWNYAITGYRATWPTTIRICFFAGLATIIPLATPPGLQFALAMCHSLLLETAVGFLRQEFHDLTSDIIIEGLHI